MNIHQVDVALCVGGFRFREDHDSRKRARSHAAIFQRRSNVFPHRGQHLICDPDNLAVVERVLFFFLFLPLVLQQAIRDGFFSWRRKRIPNVIFVRHRLTAWFDDQGHILPPIKETIVFCKTFAAFKHRRCIAVVKHEIIGHGWFPAANRNSGVLAVVHGVVDDLRRRVSRHNNAIDVIEHFVRFDAAPDVAVEHAGRPTALKDTFLNVRSAVVYDVKSIPMAHGELNGIDFGVAFGAVDTGLTISNFTTTGEAVQTPEGKPDVTIMKDAVFDDRSFGVIHKASALIDKETIVNLHHTEILHEKTRGLQRFAQEEALGDTRACFSPRGESVLIVQEHTLLNFGLRTAVF